MGDGFDLGAVSEAKTRSLTAQRKLTEDDHKAKANQCYMRETDELDSDRDTTVNDPRFSP